MNPCKLQLQMMSSDVDLVVMAIDLKGDLDMRYALPGALQVETTVFFLLNLVEEPR